MSFLNRSFVIVAVACIAGCASTDGDSDSSIIAEERLYGNIPFESVRVIKVYPKDRNSGQVRGVCFVSRTPKTYLDVPCKNVDLELLNMKGDVIYSTQTDEEGRFRFVVEGKKQFKLQAKSKTLRTLSDEIFVSPGADLLIRLINK